jgi:hypothetical protein
MATVKWASPGSYTTLIAGAASSPTLKNLANAGKVLGNAVSQATAKDQYCSLDLLCRFASAPSAGGYVDVYFIPAVDGTNYGDGDASTDPPLTYLVATLPVRAVTTAQRVGTGSRTIVMPPFDFKPLVKNNSGQAMTNTDNENVLSFRTYNDEIA